MLKAFTAPVASTIIASRVLPKEIPERLKSETVREG